MYHTGSVEVGFSPIAYTVTEGETAMLRVVLSMAFDQEVTVALQTGDVSATGIRMSLKEILSIECTHYTSYYGLSITDLDDYMGVTTIVTFPVGVTEQFVSVSTEDDDKSESLETFTATLSSANPDVVTIGQSQATVSIQDNDGKFARLWYGTP